MQHPAKFPESVFRQHHHPHHLEPTPRRAAHRPHEHQAEQEDLRHHRPRPEIGVGESGGADDGGHVEERRPEIQAQPVALVGGKRQGREAEQRGAECHPRIDPPLHVAEPCPAPPVIMR